MEMTHNLRRAGCCHKFVQDMGKEDINQGYPFVNPDYEATDARPRTLWDTEDSPESTEDEDPKDTELGGLDGNQQHMWDSL